MLEIDKIYKMDCLEGMKLIADNSIDLIVTDPPYGISYKTNRRKEEHKFKHEIVNDDNFDFIGEYISECYRILKDNTACFMFCSAKTLSFFQETAEKVGFVLKNTIIWDKGNWTAGDLEAQFGQQYEPLLLLNKGRKIINGKRLGDIWHFPRVPSVSLLHQNEKPINLIRQCLLTHSELGG